MSYTFVELRPKGNVNANWLLSAIEGDTIVLVDEVFVCISTDGGKTWNNVAPLGWSNYWNDISISGNCIVLARDNLIAISSDLGETWEEITPIKDIPDIYWVACGISGSLVVVGCLGILYPEDGEYAVFVSNDYGEHWVGKVPSSTTEIQSVDIGCIDVDGDTIFCGGDEDGRLYISTDRGNNFTRVQPIVSEAGYIYKNICVSGSNLGVCHMHYYYDSGLYLSKNTGASFSLYNPYAESGHVNSYGMMDCWIDRVDNNKIIFSTKYGFPTGALSGVYISEDAGDTWTRYLPSGNDMEDWRTCSCNNGVFIVAAYGGRVWKTEVTVKTISAERSSVYARTVLKGEIIIGEDIIKRGFEYVIQNTEPEEDDERIEILEENEEGFEPGEYELMNQELYDQKDDTIWWFRAICYLEDIKHYGEWMKNIPTVNTLNLISQLALNAIPMVVANGQIIDKGANDITERGFRIIKEYKGDQWGMNFYISIIFGNFNVMEEIEKHTILGGDDGYTVIGYYWTGKFYRDSVEKNGFEVGTYERTLGGGILGEGFGIYLKQNDTYLIQAIARNNLGTGYGELKSITTMQGTSIGVTNEQKIGYNKFEKTVTLGTVPAGLYVTRIGIRLGRTKSCSELHYYNDGNFTTGNSVTFMVELEPNSTYYIMPYIVINYGSYEEEILGMMNYTDPDMEDEYLTNYPVEVTDNIDDIEDEDGILSKNAQAGEGNYSYRQIEKEIKCEKIGEQSLIDYYGRRRSCTVSNHLIQTKNLCCIIISDYLNKFQRIKLKVAVDIDMPIPFEEEDTILLGDGKTLFKSDMQGTVLFKADGEGTLLQNSFILAKIRKIGAIYTSGTETIISLELEV